MRSLITSYLLQCKECILPGIGDLKIIHTSASTDHSGHKLLPPFQTTLFNKNSQANSPGLVEYISKKRQIQKEEAADLLDNFCSEWKKKIQAGEKMILESIGTLQKSADGISFERYQRFAFFQPVAIGQPYKKEEKKLNEITEAPAEQILKETIPVNEEIIIERSYWELWAIILLAIGLVTLFYQFKDHPLSVTSVGNQHILKPGTTTTTYSIP